MIKLVAMVGNSSEQTVATIQSINVVEEVCKATCKRANQFDCNSYREVNMKLFQEKLSNSPSYKYINFNLLQYYCAILPFILLSMQLFECYVTTVNVGMKTEK